MAVQARSASSRRSSICRVPRRRCCGRAPFRAHKSRQCWGVCYWTHAPMRRALPEHWRATTRRARGWNWWRSPGLPRASTNCAAKKSLSSLRRRRCSITAATWCCVWSRRIPLMNTPVVCIHCCINSTLRVPSACWLRFRPRAPLGKRYMIVCDARRQVADVAPATTAWVQSRRTRADAERIRRAVRVSILAAVQGAQSRAGNRPLHDLPAAVADRYSGKRAPAEVRVLPPESANSIESNNVSKKVQTGRHTMRSFSWGRPALSLFVAATGVLLLVSCGGGGSNGKVQIDSVASFGDSLSDLGTYQVGPIAAAGGGRFTTNPAKIWVEYVAEAYGQSITRNRTSGFGTPVAVSGGTAYGQGGSRVTSQPGIGNTGQESGVDTGASTLPITDQVTAHLAAVGGVIPPTQLILVLGGDNDIFYQAGVVSASGGTPAAVAAAQTAAGTAGAQLAAQVKRLVAAGAKNVVVLTAFDPAFSLATGGSASTAALFNALTLADRK